MPFMFMLLVPFMFLVAFMLMMVVLLKLLAAVLLVADDGLQPTVRQIQRVVPHHFVMLHLLVRQPFAVTVSAPTVGVAELSRLSITLTLDDARSLVIGCPRQPRVAPPFLKSQHQAARHLLELRARHVPVVFVFVGMCHLAAPTGIPHQPHLVSTHVERIAQQAIVGLVLRGDIAPQFTFRQRRWPVEDDDTRHRVRTVHQ